jgi:hypothetical protein
LVLRLEALGRGDEAKGVLFDGFLKAWFDAGVVVALKVSLVGERRMLLLLRLLEAVAGVAVREGLLWT